MEYLSTAKPSYQQRQLLARLLRETRARAGLTQVDLAERLDMPQSVVSKIEAGHRRLDLIELRSLCVALGSSLSLLISEFERLVQSEQEAHETR